MSHSNEQSATGVMTDMLLIVSGLDACESSFQGVVFFDPAHVKTTLEYFVSVEAMDIGYCPKDEADFWLIREMLSLAAWNDDALILHQCQPDDTT